jgi:hypothetical protein
LDGASASIALSALGKALLSDSEASAAQIAAIISNADKLKIQAAEQEAQLRLQQNDGGSLDDLVALAKERTAEEKNRLDDTERARQRQVQEHDNTNKHLAYWVSGGFFVLLLCLIGLNIASFWWPVATTIASPYKEILFTLLGVVATGWANIIGFYFGSSAGSMQKSMAINAALNKTIPQAGQDGGGA